MNETDMINGGFELFGSFMIALNIREILRDRSVRGVHWGSTTFMTCWGFWNLVFYPSLGCWYSFAGGCALVTSNLTWLYLLWKFRTNSPHH